MAVLEVRTRSRQSFIRKLLRSPSATVGLVTIVAFAVVAVLANTIATQGPFALELQDRLLPPNSQYLLGTDHQGRDLLSRIVLGSRVSLGVGLVAVLGGCVIGVPLGLTAGFFGGVYDRSVMALMDVLLAFPQLLLAITIVAAIGPGMFNAMIAITVWQIPTYVRIVRGTVLSTRNAEYVESARALQASPLRIMFKHILPNIMSPIIVHTSLQLPRAILTEAGLSFLGLGVQPPFPSWGSIASEGRAFLFVAPHITIFAGLAIMFVVIGLNLLGDGVRDILDPRAN